MDIKESLEVLSAVEAVCDALVKAADDGKLTILDARHLLAPAKAAVVAVKGRELIPGELKDVDEAELAAFLAKGESLAVKAIAALEALGKLAG